MLRHKIIGIGEILCDIFPEARCPGGAPMNFCYHINQLGHEGILLSAISEDKIGQELHDFLVSHGLSTEGIQTQSKYPSGQVLVDVSEPDNPKYEILESVAWDYLKLSKTYHKLMKSASAIYFGTLSQRNINSRVVIHQILDEAPPKCLRVFDVNLKQKFYTREIIEISFLKANMVKMSLPETYKIAKLLKFEGEHSPEKIGKWLASAYNIQKIGITLGEDGCLLIERTPGGMHFLTEKIPGRKVKVCDAVGCGDGFTAAWVYGVLENWELRKQGEFANWLGSLIATRQGSCFPYSPKMREIIQKLTMME
ncbi:MAG: PfkB family carbohydrate kinase [Planctomycetia bacterium]|nr:PfkB family carbohydrate kinase [Planctomycetia bacterium]